MRKLASHTFALLLTLAMSASFPLAQTPAGSAAPDPKQPANIAGHANQVRGDEITPESKAAVEKGLAWLAGRQANDGGFSGMQGFGYSNNVAMTALAGPAFMEHVSLPGRGKDGKEVPRRLPL